MGNQVKNIGASLSRLARHGGRMIPDSGRQEYEITDVNNSYLGESQLTHEILDGWWTDAGTFESLWRASNLVREKAHRAAEHSHASHGGS